jgi:hypothetical protein
MTDSVKRLALREMCRWRDVAEVLMLFFAFRKLRANLPAVTLRRDALTENAGKAIKEEIRTQDAE